MAMRRQARAPQRSANLHYQGVQANGASFAKLGLPRDAPSSARHEGVPVLLTDLEPDTLLFAFAQRWP